jgi:hypothetical protein
MKTILRNNLKAKLNLINNSDRYNLTEKQKEESYIDFIAYLKLYVKKFTIDEFIKELIKETEVEEYILNKEVSVK